MKDIWNSLCPLTMVRWKLAIKTSKKMSKPISFLCGGALPLRNTVSNGRQKPNTGIIYYFFFFFKWFILFIQPSNLKSQRFWNTLHFTLWANGKIHILKWYFFRLVSFSKNVKALLSGPQSPNFLRQVVVRLCYIITSVIVLKFRTSFSDLMKFNRKLL